MVSTGPNAYKSFFAFERLDFSLEQYNSDAILSKEQLEAAIQQHDHHHVYENIIFSRRVELCSATLPYYVETVCVLHGTLLED